MTDPVYTDPNAFRAPTPAAPPAVDRSGPIKELGRIGENLFQLGRALYQHDQEATVLRAQVEAAKGFTDLTTRAEQTTDVEEAQRLFSKGALELQNQILSTAGDDRTRGAIELVIERAGLKATANLHANITRRKAEADLSMAAQREEQLLQEAASYPDIDLEALKEEGDGLWMGRFRSGSVSEDRATGKMLALRARMDLIKATQAVNSSPEQAFTLLDERDSDGGFANFIDLDPMQRETLKARAQAGMKKQTANVNEVMRTNVMNARAGRPTETVEDFAARGATDSQVQDYAGNLEASQYAHNVYRQAQLAPMGETQAFIDRIAAKAAPGQPNYEYYGTALEWAQNKLAQENQRWRSDPAAQADTVFPLPEHPRASEGQTWELGQRVAQRIAAFQAKGLPRSEWQYMTEQEATGITQQFMDMPPDGRPMYVQQVIGSAGVYADEVVSQLLSTGPSGGRMPPEFMVMQDVNPLAAMKLSQIVGKTGTDIRSRYSDPTEATQIERDMIDLFNEGIGRGLIDTDVADATRKAAVRLALDMGSAEEAYGLLWGEKEMTGTVRWPDGMPAGHKQYITRQMDTILDDPMKYGLIPEGATPETIYATKQDLLNSAEWKTYPGQDGRDAGVMLMWKGVPWQSRYGGPVTIPFAVAMGAPLEEQPAPPATEVEAQWRDFGSRVTGTASKAGSAAAETVGSTLSSVKEAVKSYAEDPAGYLRRLWGGE